MVLRLTMNRSLSTSDHIMNSFIETVLPLLRREIAPSKVLIFGSRIRGNAAPESDIDVIVVSDYFEGMKFVRRMSTVLKKIKFSRHVDFICYTPKEFEEIKDSSTIVKEALAEGVFV